MLGNFCYRVPLPELERQVLRGINGELLQGLRELPYASPEEVPENLKRAVVRVEDRRFYWHLGVDPIAILRAMRFNLTSIGKVQGASTLPQQLVKLTEKAYHRGWKQKLWEMGLAFNLSLHYSKQELLLAYLNQVEFLNGVRGYRSACLSYFGKECAALFPSELSFLIATAQTGKNPLRQGDFQVIKAKAEALCQVAFSKEQCDRWEELPPLSAKALLLQPNRSVFQFSDYYL